MLRIKPNSGLVRYRSSNGRGQESLFIALSSLALEVV